ncbi:MAG: hypothetical protein MH204_07955 [Fimbriimonadaceae bacterium]|nr:hypothetical protein [Fimbriimonadaceae bacterium]
MLITFSPETFAVVIRPYVRPYEDPIALRLGDRVIVDLERTQETDFVGWSWCTGPDGRQGWVPDSWLEDRLGEPRIIRDFSALELTVKPGDRVALHCSESGFVLATHEDGRTGWIPDACLQLAEPSDLESGGG